MAQDSLGQLWILNFDFISFATLDSSQQVVKAFKGFSTPQLKTKKINLNLPPLLHSRFNQNERKSLHFWTIKLEAIIEENDGDMVSGKWKLYFFFLNLSQ